MENPVIIFGANHLGKTAREIFETNGVEVYGFLDDDEKLHGKELDEVSILGATDNDGFLKLIGKKCEAFVAVDDTRLRKSLVKMLIDVRKTQPVNAIHGSSSISKRSALGHGNLIDNKVIISTGAELGAYNIVQTGAIIGVDSRIGSHVQIGAGAVISPLVTIEDEAFIGSGVVIVSGVTIGKGARVGAGSVVIASVPAGETVFGNPAQPVKK